MTDLALATCSSFPLLDAHEAPLLAALERQGLSAQVVPWDEPTVSWADYRMCLLRMTWDYHLRLPEFLAWATRITAVTRLWNPLPILQWNVRKTYLRELAARNVPVIPTAWLARRARISLSELLATRDWPDAVVKPVIGASSFGAMRVNLASALTRQGELDAWLVEREMMVQPYIPGVEGAGERSVVVIAGELTHAVRRNAALATPSVVGARPIVREVTPVAIAPDEESFVRQVLASLDFAPLYARVDLVRDGHDRPMLMELELVEPSLFLDRDPYAADRLAVAIKSCLN